MAIQSDPPVIGKALIVDGTVRIESINGLSQIIRPNAPIHLDDRIETGSDGSVSIALTTENASQLDLGRMSQMIIDEDVAGGSLPDFSDVAVEAGPLTDLLENWESIESNAPLETIMLESEESGAEETAAADTIPGLEDSSSKVDSSDSIDEGVSSLDDELDITNLIPPPEDAS